MDCSSPNFRLGPVGEQIQTEHPTPSLTSQDLNRPSRSGLVAVELQVQAGHQKVPMENSCSQGLACIHCSGTVVRHRAVEVVLLVQAEHWKVATPGLRSRDLDRTGYARNTAHETAEVELQFQAGN
jgi:hypothetical protein